MLGSSGVSKLFWKPNVASSNKKFGTAEAVGSSSIIILLNLGFLRSISPSWVAVAPDGGLLKQGAVQCCISWFGAALMAARAVEEEPCTACVNGRSWPGSQAHTAAEQFAWCLLAFQTGARFKTILTEICVLLERENTCQHLYFKGSS